MQTKSRTITVIAPIAAFLLTTVLFFISNLFWYFIILFLIILTAAFPIIYSFFNIDSPFFSSTPEKDLSILALTITLLINVSIYKIPNIAQQNQILNQLDEQMKLNCNVKDRLGGLVIDQRKLETSLPMFRFETDYFRNNANIINRTFSKRYGSYNLTTYIQNLEVYNKTLDHLENLDIYKNNTEDEKIAVARNIASTTEMIKESAQNSANIFFQICDYVNVPPQKKADKEMFNILN